MAGISGPGPPTPNLGSVVSPPVSTPKTPPTDKEQVVSPQLSSPTSSNTIQFATPTAPPVRGARKTRGAPRLAVRGSTKQRLRDPVPYDSMMITGKGSRGRRGPKKQDLVRVVQSTNEDEEVDVESPTNTGIDTKMEHQSRARSQIFKDLPTNLPIGQFSSFQRDIGDSDDDDSDGLGDMVNLTNAGAFTAEEISLILKNKFAQLHDLYMDQFDDLKEQYKLKRAQFLRTKVRLCRSKVPFTTNPQYLVRDEQSGITDEFIHSELHQYKYHKKLLQYHKHNGQRAVLYKMAMEKFQELKDKETGKSTPMDTSASESEEKVEVDESEPNSYHDFCEEVRKLKTVEHVEPPKVVVRCEYTGPQGNEPRCPDPALPLTKLCHAHILHNGKQHLFKPCGRQLPSGLTCDIPVLGLIDKLGCSMHHMPVVRDLSESPEKKRTLETNIAAQPKIRSHKKAVPYLEKLVVNEAVSVEHIRGLVAKTQINSGRGNDTDDSEEFEDELAGIPPGPSYMTINL